MKFTTFLAQDRANIIIPIGCLFFIGVGIAEWYTVSLAVAISWEVFFTVIPILWFVGRYRVWKKLYKS